MPQLVRVRLWISRHTFSLYIQSFGGSFGFLLQFWSNNLSLFAARSLMLIQKLCLFVQCALQGIHPFLSLACFTVYYWCLVCCHTYLASFSFSETWRSLLVISLTVFSRRRANNFVKRFNDVPSAVTQLETINVQRKYFKLCLHPQATRRSCIIYHSF